MDIKDTERCIQSPWFAEMKRIFSSILGWNISSTSGGCTCTIPSWWFFAGFSLKKNELFYTSLFEWCIWTRKWIHPNANLIINMDKSFNLHPFLSTGPAGCYSLHVQLLFVQSICFQGYIYGWELMSLVSVATMETMAAVLNGSRCSGFYCHSFVKDLRTSWPKTFPSPRMSEGE